MAARLFLKLLNASPVELANVNGGFRGPSIDEPSSDRRRGIRWAGSRAQARFSIGQHVIDGQNYNLFQPLLYQVATAELSPADIAAPIRSLLNATNTRMLLDEVVDIDPLARQLRMSSGGDP